VKNKKKLLVSRGKEIFYVVRAQSMFCAHFLIQICVIFCLFISFYLLAFFDIIRDFFMCFLSFAGNFGLNFQEFQVVSRVTFTRNSLHARLHSR
jgi:hypothetical protein